MLVVTCDTMMITQKKRKKHTLSDSSQAILVKFSSIVCVVQSDFINKKKGRPEPALGQPEGQGHAAAGPDPQNWGRASLSLALAPGPQGRPGSDPGSQGPGPDLSQSTLSAGCGLPVTGTVTILSLN